MRKLLPFAVASAFTALSSLAFAQAQPQDPSNPMREGQSPRCDALSGEARDQCMKDEGAKTENKQDDSKDSSAASGASSAAPADTSRAETPSATETPASTETAK